MIKVTDIKQFAYCKRIIYFTYCMPLDIKKTYKMTEGKRRHKRNEELEPNRTLQRYGLETGEKKYSVNLSSSRLGLRGEVDLMVITENEYIPIELKYTTHQPGINHKYQLVAYCLLIEEEYQTIVKKGLIHLIPAKETIEIKLNTKLRDKLKEIIADINFIIESEQMPEATNDRGKCRDCEYRNYCADVM